MNPDYIHNGGTIGAVNVTPTATQIFAERSSSSSRKRTFLRLTNISSTHTVWIAMNETAAVGQGIPIFPQKSYEINATNFTQAAITAIIDGPEGTTVSVAYQEG